ncbi:MAG TPA: hypothetical protein VF525_16530 [Pyrinomonadaceae bacterium]|jgi:hypothetical protein
MTKIKVGKLTRRPLTLIGLLACLTLGAPANAFTSMAAAPAHASGYHLYGTVNYFGSSSGAVINANIIIYKWNGSSWVYHGFANADSCGNFDYDAGGPGTYMGSVDGYFNVGESAPWTCSSYYHLQYVHGSGSADAYEDTYVVMDIFTI